MTSLPLTASRSCSSHHPTRLAALRWGEVGHGMHSPDPAAWGQVHKRGVWNWADNIHGLTTAPAAVCSSIRSGQAGQTIRTWTIPSGGQLEKVLCRACCARVGACHGQVVPAMRLREGHWKGARAGGSSLRKPTMSLSNGPPLA